MNIQLNPSRMKDADKRGFQWQPEQIKDIAARWNSGHSARVIGAAYGVSKNAIIGLAGRNKDLFSPKRKKTASAPAEPVVFGEPVKSQPNWNSGFFKSPSKKGMTLTAKRKACIKESEEHAKIILTQADKTEYDKGRANEAVTLENIAKSGCHWPINNGGPFLFCNAETDGKVYCHHHMMRRYGRGNVA